MLKQRPSLFSPPLLAACAAFLLASVLTWPIVLHPGSMLIGHPGNDIWNHVWGYWWVFDQLKSGVWPVNTELLSFPRGGSLYFIDTIQVLLSLPVQWLFGPVVAYNVVVLFQLAFSGFAAWLLARRLVGDDLAAGVAMVIYGAAPHLLGQTFNGISETVCAGWFPFTLWCLLRLLDRPNVKRALILGVAGGICMLSSWYYGLFAAIGSVVLLLWRATRQAWLQPWGKTIASLAISSGVALSMIMPMLMSFRASLDAEDALVSRDPEFVEASLLNHNITDFIAFFHPTKTPSPDLYALYGEELIIVIYIGWIGVMFAGYALYASRRYREFSPWLWLGGIFFIFSLGPYLNVGGEYVELFGRQIPLPFLPLYKVLPIFERISHPFRFVIGVNLSIAMVAAHGLRHMLRNKSSQIRVLSVAALSLFVLIETALFSPAHLPVPLSDARIPTAYHEMVEDPVSGAVLDLPMTVPNLERAVYVWYQSVHGRPVPWGLNEPMPMNLLINRLTATLIRLEATRAQVAAPQLPELDLVVSARALSRVGYRYIVVHEDLYPAFKSRQVSNVLTALFGEPQRHPEDRILVYVVEPIAE